MSCEEDRCVGCERHNHKNGVPRSDESSSSVTSQFPGQQRCECAKAKCLGSLAVMPFEAFRKGRLVRRWLALRVSAITRDCASLASATSACSPPVSVGSRRSIDGQRRYLGAAGRVELKVGGLKTNERAALHKRWIDTSLRVGDEIRVHIIDAQRVDAATTEYRGDPVKDVEVKKAPVRRMAQE